MTQVGRRIIFEKETGKIIFDMGEMQGDVLPREPLGELDHIDLEYGQDTDKFMRVKSYHIDVKERKVFFDELYEPMETQEQQLAKLQQELLIAKGVI